VIVIGAVLTAALVAPAWFWHGGVLEAETLRFITHYTSSLPLLDKVFDAATNDFGTYQARELSYFIDYLDAEFYALLVARFDVTLFVPLSSMLASVLLAGALLAGIYRTMPNIGTWTATWLTACFVSSFEFLSTMGVFYRSGKPLLAVAVVTFLFHVRNVHRKRSLSAPVLPDAGRDWWIALALLVFAGLLDRQGVFYVGLAGLTLLVHYRATRELGDLLGAVAISAAILITYNLGIAPVLTYALNGYWPGFSYQLVHPGRALSPRYLWIALHLLLENTAGMFGGWRPGTPMLVAGFTLGSYFVARRLSVSRPLQCAVLVLAGQVVMFALMSFRHSPIYEWVDHRHWYYPLPFLGTVVFGVAAWLDRVIPRLGQSGRRMVAAVLLLGVMSNIASLGHLRTIMASGPWFGPVFAQSEWLKASLRSGLADPRLNAEYRWFFDVDRALRRGVRPASPRE